MKWPFKKSAPAQPKTKFQEWRDSIVFSVVVATLFRWSMVEAFVIPTPSMENSLLVGDYLFVSKIHYGPRTPRTPLQIPLTHQKIWGTNIPSYLDWIQLPSMRLPGLRDVRRGEPVVFNVPKDLLDPTERPIDLKTYLVKRCVAIHGDELKIVNRQLSVNGQVQPILPGMKFSYLVTAKDEINQRLLNSLGLDSNDYTFLGRTDNSRAAYSMFLTSQQLEAIKTMPVITSVTETPEDFQRSGLPLFPLSENERWTADNYGAIRVPEKDMKIAINDSTLSLYGELITKYESNDHVVIGNGKLTIDGKEVAEYKFKQNYYFMMGDSRHNSLDSRYWGFVPEDHVLGKPLFIWFSYDSDANILNKVRWKRLFTLIE